MEIEDLSKIAVLTGSRAFGCANTSSDWDFVITKENADKVLKNEKWKTCNPFETDKDYDGTIYGDTLVDIVKFVNSEDKLINLFIFEDIETVEIFHKVNQVMLMFKEEIVDKTIRIQKWKASLALCGIRYHVTEETAKPVRLLF